jgi:hypothetical protein
LNLFFYFDGHQAIHQGVYDQYFLLLTAHQLGKSPRFIPGLYGNGLNHQQIDTNPLLMQWLQQSSTDQDVRQQAEIDLEELYGRRLIYDYNLANARLAPSFEERHLFDIADQASEQIFHDLLHAELANRAAVDSFVEWANNQEQQNLLPTMRLDLIEHPVPVTPQDILPEIKNAYYGWRSNVFDFDTLNVFTEAYTRSAKGDSQGPQ